ncbi:hypothetical protein [Georgenia sp. H159]|uniref:hypothetical protein n=1 Tax=Georgenia sp. H159 TaxID=3076115 RepID=UPI002D7701AD|nr:hypothetical protein [Georgenia sp. H159]
MSSISITLDEDQQERARIPRFFSDRGVSHALSSEFTLPVRATVATRRYTAGSQAWKRLRRELDCADIGGNIAVAVGSRYLILKSAKLDHFGGGAYLLRTKYALDEQSTDIDFEEFEIAHRAFQDHSSVKHLENRIADLALGDTLVGETLSRRSLRSIHATFPTDPTAMARFLRSNRHALVELHIGSQSATPSDPRLAARVLENSDNVNIKDEAQLLLLNRQGVSHYETRGTTSPYGNRFEKALLLLEVGTVFQQVLLDAGRRGYSRKTWEQNPTLSRWIDHPLSTFFSSVTNRLIWESVARSLALREILSEVRAYSG